ncbi:MAG: hypothetical protein [Enterobacter phage ENC19]|nr:MAG: hypothetical protein [Enterobacter phage ENC19]
MITKNWDDEFQAEIRRRFYHVNGVLYHKTESKQTAFSPAGYYFKPGDMVKCHKTRKKTPHVQICMRYDGKSNYLYVHRVVWFLEYGYQVDTIDHIDLNPLNNDPSNLREASTQQNHYNKNGKPNTSSTYKGVSWDKSTCKWKVGIQHNKKKIHLGYFDDEVEAAKAYDAKAIEIGGQYARLNFHENVRT